MCVYIYAKYIYTLNLHTHTLINLVLTTTKIDIITIPILQMTKVSTERLGYMPKLTQLVTDGAILYHDFLALESMLSITLTGLEDNPVWLGVIAKGPSSQCCPWVPERRVGSGN